MPLTLNTMVYPLTEQTIVVLGVQQNYGLGVDVQLRPCNNLQKFFHSTKTTRKCDESITLIKN
jgi:hypothetical protein